MTKTLLGSFAAAILGVTLIHPIAHATDRLLISEAEMRLYSPMVSPMASQGLQSAQGAPSILWVQPASGATVHSPMDIQILVVPNGSTMVDWDSLRVFYGALRFDITERIWAKAQRDVNQLSIRAVEVPNGVHRLLIQVADTEKRQGQRELVLHVDGAKP
jgi:hypothetical protein